MPFLQINHSYALERHSSPIPLILDIPRKNHGRMPMEMKGEAGEEGHAARNASTRRTTRSKKAEVLQKFSKDFWRRRDPQLRCCRRSQSNFAPPCASYARRRLNFTATTLLGTKGGALHSIIIFVPRFARPPPTLVHHLLLALQLLSPFA